MNVRGAATSVAFGLLWIVGCASTPDPASHARTTTRDESNGVVHTLRPGENLYRLSQFYRVPVAAIARSNRIVDVTELQIGQQLWIPGAANRPPTASLAASSSSPSRPPASQAPRASKSGLDLLWPVRGPLSSRFGWRNGRRHEGIDIPARRGTPIRAAQSGRVIHSGTGLGDYGKVVIVKHEGRYSTVYAHNDRIKVKKGQFIEKGDIIGEVGTSGNASGPHVHFELRRDRKPLDPLVYLP